MVTVIYATSGILGLFDALASLREALGNYSCGYIPTVFGFENLFMFSAILFALAFILFYFSLKAK